LTCVKFIFPCSWQTLHILVMANRHQMTKKIFGLLSSACCALLLVYLTSYFGILCLWYRKYRQNTQYNLNNSENISFCSILIKQTVHRFIQNTGLTSLCPEIVCYASYFNIPYDSACSLLSCNTDSWLVSTFKTQFRYFP